MPGGFFNGTQVDDDDQDDRETYEERRQRSRDANDDRYDAITKAMREG